MNQVEGLTQSTKDIRKAASLVGESEIMYLVNSYYQIQEFRKASANMVTALTKDQKPCEITNWIALSQHRIEDHIKLALDVYTEKDDTGQWLKSVHGIGPVLAAGLLAHIDIHKAPTCGHVWSFAGLNPSQEWKKGERRPWNADLKVLCWKIGDSFVKSGGSEKSFYGPVYRQRKEVEVERNERGDFAELAKATLEKRKIREAATRACYESGRLPPGRLDLRARRIAVKLFLSHFHDVLMWNKLGVRAPRPYAFDRMEGHAHFIEAPNAPWPF